jgi:LPXTG-site transpeptidase (sortase) family protein
MIALQKTLGRVLVVTGALAFLLWGYLMGHGFLFQRAASRMLQEQISHASLAREQGTAPLDTAITPLRKGQAIGRLEIPRINMSVIVLEGSDSSILDVAAGHIPGTALPGASGNIGIAAHRDTFFRSLREIRPNDRLTFTTPIRTFEYGVESTEVVDPENVGVLGPTVDAELTLVTCYPFNYIGAAPKRFIVHARQWN